ncbi:hypothetical protein CEXT_767561 [Caerostris extrusa]|uniref:Uncharacterized protein n=1 Tax=Caerostris extrusa TaxID=172846 RepID=A0AAV4XEP4_CAEEX|nr:hypothetical protein CEXT_767561 [Caerostris extrusa]
MLTESIEDSKETGMHRSVEFRSKLPCREVGCDGRFFEQLRREHSSERLSVSRNFYLMLTESIDGSRERYAQERRVSPNVALSRSWCDGVAYVLEQFRREYSSERLSLSPNFYLMLTESIDDSRDRYAQERRVSPKVALSRSWCDGVA